MHEPPAQQGLYARNEKSVTETWFEIGVLSCAFEEKRREWMRLPDDKLDCLLYYRARKNKKEKPASFSSYMYKIASSSTQRNVDVTYASCRVFV